jgi:hypothetical protein
VSVIGWKNDGQPQWEWNFVSDSKSFAPHARHE